jgi:hypothetical protein
MPGKANTLVPREDGSLDVAAVMDMIRKGEKLRLAETEQDSEALAAEILERTMSATSPDALFSDGSLTSGKDYVNRPFQLQTVRFRNSDLDEGIGIYAILEGVTAHGEIVTISSSATNVVVKVIKGLELNAFPRWVKFTEDTTAKGYKVQNLVSVEAPAADGEGKPF